MKVKYSLIPFIPAALVMLALRVAGTFAVDQNGMIFGMNRMALSYTTIGVGLALFVVCILINIFDRKTAPVYPVKKNPVAGILSSISGVLVIASSTAQVINTTTEAQYYVMTIIAAVFSIPAGIAFMLMSRANFSGKSAVSGISMLFVFPALWGCCELVYEFLNATKVSISATDLTPLFAYIFITLYIFSYAMVISRIKGRNPVKGCFIYGLPAAAFSLLNALNVFLTASQEGFTYVNILNGLMFAVLGLFALSFLFKMFSNVCTKDEIEIIDGIPDEEESVKEEDKYIDTKDYDELVFSERGRSESGKKDKKEKNANVTDDYYSSSGIDDFIIGYNRDDIDKDIPNYYSSVNGETNVDEGIVYPQKLDVVEVESGAVIPLKKVEEQPEPVSSSVEKLSEELEKARMKKKSVKKEQPAKKAEPKPEPAPKAEPKPEPKPVPKPEPKPVPKPEPKPAPVEEPLASVADDDGISSDRLNEIERLLQELENKK